MQATYKQRLQRAVFLGKAISYSPYNNSKDWQQRKPAGISWHHIGKRG